MIRMTRELLFRLSGACALASLVACPGATASPADSGAPADSGETPDSGATGDGGVEEAAIGDSAPSDMVLHATLVTATQNDCPQQLVAPATLDVTLTLSSPPGTPDGGIGVSVVTDAGGNPCMFTAAWTSTTKAASTTAETCAGDFGAWQELDYAACDLDLSARTLHFAWEIANPNSIDGGYCERSEDYSF